VALTHGVELMQRLNDGDLEQAPSVYLQQTREAVSVAIEELLEVGARVRPLLVGDQRIGWIRGVHPAERKALKRWIFDEIELIEHLLLLGTTLALEDIRSLSMVEMRSLSRVMRAMTDSDLRLYPYISAFVSEQLWYSKGTEVTAFQERIIPLPDGKKMRVLTACDQAKLWATLCNYRMHAKQRLDASMNAVLIIRPWVGKGADPIAASLPARQQFVGAGPNAIQTGQIERDQFEAATIRRGVLLHLRGRGFGFLEVPPCSCHLRAVGRKSPRRLNANARGHAGDENAFPVQIDPRQNLVGS
jgi:hypothetical protein